MKSLRIENTNPALKLESLQINVGHMSISASFYARMTFGSVFDTVISVQADLSNVPMVGNLSVDVAIFPKSGMMFFGYAEEGSAISNYYPAPINNFVMNRLSSSTKKMPAAPRLEDLFQKALLY